MSDAVVLLHRLGRTLELRLTQGSSDSSFGGPLRFSVAGVELERPLHNIAFIGASVLLAAGVASVNGLPLVHGMRYDGSEMQYRFNDAAIFVDSLSPRYASDHWPYSNYPTLFPLHHLEVGRVVQEPWSAFSRRTFELPSPRFAELVVVVPNPEGLGFSLWGPSADPALVFECSLANRQVFTHNVYD